MIATVTALLTLAAGTWPEVYVFNGRPGRSLVEPFEERVREVAAELGEPRRETRLAWYPFLEEAVLWARDGKTVILAREPEGRCGARVVRWCVTDARREAQEAVQAAIAEAHEQDRWERAQLAA
jgi:hypothetical protein